jgi:acyl-CoA-binding protein
MTNAAPLQGQELKNQFLQSEQMVNENRVQVPESLKMKLYGLGKQIKEGDCRMPQPPA